MPLVRVFAALLTTAVAACALPAGAPAATLPPEPVRLDTGWEHLPDDADAGIAAGLASGVAGEGWQPVRIPHLFQHRPVEERFGGTVGWYRLRFEAPAAPAGFGWDLRFEQVRRVAQVWLNGRPLGTHRDPYVPFTLPARNLRPGENVVVLRVDNRKGKEPREGWWNWGGISRPVWLVPRGSVALRDLGLMSQRRCAGGRCRWSVLVDGMVENTGAAQARPRVAVQVRAPGQGRTPRAQRTVAARPLAPGERAHVRFTIPVPGPPQLWQPGSPRLYEALVHTRDAGAVQQVDRRRIGLRTVTVRDGLLAVNGRPVELRGASIQEDISGRGAALTDADVAWTVRQLRDLGATVTRAHYALDERLLRAFDEAGIMVWSQAPIYHRDRLLETASQRAAALSTVRGTVMAARSHPSVITHSVANELSVVPDEVPGTRRFLDAARRLTRHLDPTLPTSVDLLSYPGYARQDTYARFDLLGINSYFGWYPGKKDHSTADVRDLAPFLRSMRRMYARQGLVLTEFGAESTMQGPPNVKETFAFQASYVRQVLDIVRRQRFMSGAIYWTLREFAVKPDWDGGAKREGVERDGIHNKGLITYGGTPKPAYRVMRDDARATALWRDPADVAAATGRDRPRHGRGTGGAVLAALVLAGLAGMLIVDLWAFRGLMGAWRLEARRRRELEALAADGERPKLRVVA